jgi:hypothetical protein
MRRSSALLPPVPQRDGCRIDPQAFLGLSRFLLKSFKFRISWRILPIPPTPAVFDQRVVDVGPILDNAYGRAPTRRGLRSETAKPQDTR